MKDVVETRHFYLLRIFDSAGKNASYIEDVSCSWHMNRSWGLNHRQGNAYRFSNRSDARRASKAKVVMRALKEGFYWEIVKVTETIVTSFQEEWVASNAPAMLSLARSAR